MKDRILSAAAGIFTAAVLTLTGAAAQAPDPVETGREIVNWRKSEAGISRQEQLFQGKLLQTAGTTYGDWYVIGMSELGIEDDYSAYLDALESYVTSSYATAGKLSPSKATEWHRISLAMLACGGDPENAGFADDGSRIDLIADGTYDRGKTAPIDKQGINGWLWGIIALDSRKTIPPQDSFYSREDVLISILEAQLPDGGFALSGSVSDPDTTAMAVQALAPYLDSKEEYTYVREQDGEERTVTAAQVAEECLDCLSQMQLDSGGFASFGVENCESSAQVVIALCCAGVDPLTDSRFIKNSNSAVDALMSFKMSDGGFSHLLPSDESAGSDVLASGQALLAMAALYRQQNGLGGIYDFSGQQPEKPPQQEDEFSAEDIEEVRALPEKLTTEYYDKVTELLGKLESSGSVEDIPEMAEMREKLTSAKKQLEDLRSEINGISDSIKQELYPLEELGASDKEAVEQLVERWEKLSSYDRNCVAGHEDLLRAKAVVTAALKKKYLAAAAAAVLILAAASAIIFVLRRRKSDKT